jgi:hypothetical protein
LSSGSIEGRERGKLRGFFGIENGIFGSLNNVLTEKRIKN